MKLKPLLAGILLISLICAVFYSCASDTLLSTSDESALESSSETGPSQTDPEESETLPENIEREEERTTVPGFTEVNSFREVALDAYGVLEMYKNAVNEVKIRCPGFTRTDYQSVDDVTAGGGKLELANRIMGVITSELLGGENNTTTVVPPHSDVEVIKKFPIYGQSFACELGDPSILETAVCYTDGVEDKIVISVGDTLNPEPLTSDFGKILDPVDRENVASGIASYLTRIDLDEYIFDFNYTGCEITCVIDRDSGRIKSLTHKMIIDVDIDLDIDLFFFSANLLNAHGTVINKTEFTDLIWD